MSVPEFIRQAVAKENNNFEKVILHGAIGLWDCGFFDRTDWRQTLEQCLEQTSIDMQSDSIEFLDVDNSYEITFANILAESTSSAAGPPQIGKRVKRSSTLLIHDDADDSLHGKRKRFKKSTILRQDDDVANILADLKKANWKEILPAINAERNAAKYETAFERAKQIRQAQTATDVSPASNVLTVGKSLSDTLVSVPVTEFVTKVSETGIPIDTETSDHTLTENDVALRNRIERGTARSHADENVVSTNNTEQRVIYFPPTMVLFAMIDALQYQNILRKYNIIVAHIDDNYDYVIAERICCSPALLTAIVSGKPIVSIRWIHALGEQNVWLDPLTYLLKDNAGEKKFNFDLAVTQQMARNKRLFENYSILVTPHIDAAVKSVISSGGGRILQINGTNVTAASGDEMLCVSDETDKQMWPKLQRKYPTLKKIISLDGFLKMIFQYSHDISSADVFYQF